MQDGPLQRYRQMVQGRELAPDTSQELAAEKLQLLANRLAHYSEPRRGVLLPFGRQRWTAPEGLYLYGGVGRGKTMLLDLFFDSVHYAPKRRVHFQEFMAEAQKNRALVILAEAEVPKAMAEAFRSGHMGIMDYYRMKNMVADTSMRDSIAGGGQSKT